MLWNVWSLTVQNVSKYQTLFWSLSLFPFISFFGEEESFSQAYSTDYGQKQNHTHSLLGRRYVSLIHWLPFHCFQNSANNAYETKSLLIQYWVSSPSGQGNRTPTTYSLSLNLFDIPKFQSLKFQFSSLWHCRDALAGVWILQLHYLTKNSRKLILLLDCEQHW